MRVCVESLQHCQWEPCCLQMREMKDRPNQILTDRKAWTMSALTELRGLSLITTKICSSFSKPMKFPNHDFLASLTARQENYTVWANAQRQKNHRRQRTRFKLWKQATPRQSLPWRGGTYSGLDSGVRLDMSSDVGTKKDKSLLKFKITTFVWSSTSSQSYSNNNRDNLLPL